MAERFFYNCNLIYGKKYDYTETHFVDIDTPIRIRCSEHGIFEIKPKMHLNLRTGKCPGCIYSKICHDRSLLKLEAIQEEEFMKNWKEISRIIQE